MKKLTKKNEQGFTLVEVGIVIAIGAVILAIALAVVPRIIATNRANAEIGNLPQISAKMQQVFANEPLYTDVASRAQDLARLGIFGDEMVVRADPTDPTSLPTAVNNRWGGAVLTTQSNIGGSLGDAVAISYAAVPAYECKEMVNGLSRTFRVIAVDTGNAGTAPSADGNAPGGTVVKQDGFRPDLLATATACGESGQVTMYFVTGK